MIEIDLIKLDRGTHTEMVNVKRGGTVFRRKQRVGQKDKPKKVDAELKDIIDTLSQYSKEYKSDNNPKMEADCNTIISLLDNDVDKAYNTFSKSDLRYDISSTYKKLGKYKDSRGSGTDWGTKPGKYVVYRAGDVTNPKRGIFFSMDKVGADAYSTGEKQTREYNIDIKNPFVMTEVKAAYSKLTGKSMADICKERDSADNVNDWWRKIDAKVSKLAKAKGYDAITYTDPAPPATRELILLDEKGIIK